MGTREKKQVEIKLPSKEEYWKKLLAEAERQIVLENQLLKELWALKAEKTPKNPLLMRWMSQRLASKGKSLNILALYAHNSWERWLGYWERNQHLF